MYKTLGFKWLFEVFCPALAFATVDRKVARNPQRFIHVSVGQHTKEASRTNRHIWFCRHTKPTLKTKRACFLPTLDRN